MLYTRWNGRGVGPALQRGLSAAMEDAARDADGSRVATCALLELAALGDGSLRLQAAVPLDADFGGFVVDEAARRFVQLALCFARAASARGRAGSSRPRRRRRSRRRGTSQPLYRGTGIGPTLGAALPKRSPSSSSPEEKFMRFERARIIGARALQIAMGAPVILDVERGYLDPVALAEREFKEGLIPITVIRPDRSSPRRKKPGITVTPKFLRKPA